MKQFVLGHSINLNVVPQAGSSSPTEVVLLSVKNGKEFLASPIPFRAIPEGFSYSLTTKSLHPGEYAIEIEARKGDARASISSSFTLA